MKITTVQTHRKVYKKINTQYLCDNISMTDT